MNILKHEDLEQHQILFRDQNDEQIEEDVMRNHWIETNQRWNRTAYELRDMVVITPAGSEWISKELPMRPGEIEALVKAASKLE